MSINKIYDHSLNDYYNQFFSKGKYYTKSQELKTIGCGEKFFRAIGSLFCLCDSTTLKCTKEGLNALIATFESNPNTFSKDLPPKFFKMGDADLKVLGKWEKSRSKTVKQDAIKIKEIVAKHFKNDQPSILPDNAPSADDIWKQEYKKEMLAADFSKAFPKGRMTAKEIQDVVDSHAEEIGKIYDIIDTGTEESIEEQLKDRVHFFPSKNIVFTVNDIPGIIFKISLADLNRGTSENKKRKELNDKFRTVLQTHSLKDLYIPEMVYLEDLKGKKVSILVEEILPLERYSYSRQEELYEFCSGDPELTKMLEGYLAQLIIFIKETGFLDIKFDNIPLLKSGVGIALPDLEPTPNYHGDSGLLQLLQNCLFPHYFALVEKALKDSTGLKNSEEIRIKQIENNKKMDALLAKKKYQTRTEKLKFDPYKAAVLTEDEKTTVDIILRVINKKLSSKGDESLRDSRRVTLSFNEMKQSKDETIQQLHKKIEKKEVTHLTSASLTKLKERGVILDFTFQGLFYNVLC